MGFSLYGSSNGVQLKQTTDEEKEEALRLLEEARTSAAQDDDTPVFELDEETSKHVQVKVDKRILALIEATDVERQLQEETRANHRNFNRMMTLVVAVVLGFIVTFGLSHNWIPNGKVLGPYSFVITVLLDTGLAAYALIKHY